METSTSKLTKEYIQSRPYIKYCLKKGILNYSSLSRIIAKELKLEKKTSIDAISISIRRLEKKLKLEEINENQIIHLLETSEIEFKNKIITIILNKNLKLSRLYDLEKKIKLSCGIFYLIEGSETFTLITQEKFSYLIEEEFFDQIILKNKNLSLIVLNSDKTIENIPGVISYLTSLFSINNINILEFLSTWRDTMFIVETQDIQKAIEILRI